MSKQLGALKKLVKEREGNVNDDDEMPSRSRVQAECNAYLQECVLGNLWFSGRLLVRQEKNRNTKSNTNVNIARKEEKTQNCRRESNRRWVKHIPNCASETFETTDPERRRNATRARRNTRYRCDISLNPGLRELRDRIFHVAARHWRRQGPLV